jgi:hypothetical protein
MSDHDSYSDFVEHCCKRTMQAALHPETAENKQDEDQDCAACSAK